MQHFSFDLSINLGQLVTMATFVLTVWRASISFARRQAQSEQVQQQTIAAIEVHTQKLADHDELFQKLVGDVQRLIGRYDEMSDRRRFPREQR